jgi:glycosyltransferase involved in cell wall biosynthesis
LDAAGVEVDRYFLDNREVTDAALMRSALRTLWSNGSYHAVRDRLACRRYDLVHVKNFFPQISPSVHWAAKAAAVPVIQDLHNYRLACLNGYFFRHGQRCESCAGRLPWRGVLHACYRDSVLGSSMVASMLAVHRAAGTWKDKVDLFITPSDHARRMLSSAIPAERVAVNPSFVADQGAGDGAGGFALFVGRLSPKKGIATALLAWSAYGAGLPELRIVDDGPMEGAVLDAAAQRPSITYLGRRKLSEVLALMARAKLLLFPSECHETFGRTVIEAMSVGTPVVCSRGALIPSWSRMA